MSTTFWIKALELILALGILVMIHEFGHYLAYQSPEKIKRFNNLCWKGKQKTCSSEAFISNYAKTNADEDFAESFTYRYFTQQQQRKNSFYKPIKNEGSIVKKKLLFFEDFLPGQQLSL